MSLRNMSQSSLITNTRYFTGALRPQLLGQPTMAWAPAVLDELLDDLVALEADPQEEAAEARAEATAADATFDNLARALYWLCKARQALALAGGDTDGAIRFGQLRRSLLPDGLAVVNWSYVEEAAEADRVEGRLDDADRALMVQTQAFGQTLAELTARWQASAQALGEADRRRTEIEADVAINRVPELSRVRKRWMDTIRAMRAAAALLSPTERASLFLKLDESEMRADARVAARRAAGAASAAVDADEVLPLDGSDVRAGADAADEPAADEPAAEPVAPPVAAERPQPIARPLPSGAGSDSSRG